MSLFVRSELIFGIKGNVTLSYEEEVALMKMGVDVSPCAYRYDDRTDKVIVGIRVDSLSNVGQDLKVSEITDSDKINMKDKIITALEKIGIDIPENKEFCVFLNSYYY